MKYGLSLSTVRPRHLGRCRSQILEDVLPHWQRGLHRRRSKAAWSIRGRSARKTLRAVARGQQVRVTLRGRPLADIVPVAASANGDRLRQLVAQGQLVTPSLERPIRLPDP